MAERCLLHKNKLHQFQVWLESKGYTIFPCKGLYEVLRARKGKDTVIIYERNSAKEHLTVQQKDYGLVRQFIRERESKEKEMMNEKFFSTEGSEPIDTVKELVEEMNTISQQEFDQEIKADKGKPQCRLVPSEIVRAIARIREYGLKKYGDKESWKSVSIDRYQDAMYRHLLAYIENPTGVDEESGLPHLWHLACNVAFLCSLHKNDFEMNKGGVIK